MNSFLSVTHRPLVVTTEEYGKLWLSLSHDVKQNLKLLTDAGDPLRTTLNALKDALQLHVVDIIGKKTVRWPRELNALQLQKTHANRKSNS